MKINRRDLLFASGLSLLGGTRAHVLLPLRGRACRLHQRGLRAPYVPRRHTSLRCTPAPMPGHRWRYPRRLERAPSSRDAGAHRRQVCPGPAP